MPLVLLVVRRASSASACCWPAGWLVVSASLLWRMRRLPPLLLQHQRSAILRVRVCPNACVRVLAHGQELCYKVRVITGDDDDDDDDELLCICIRWAPTHCRRRRCCWFACARARAASTLQLFRCSLVAGRE